MKAYFLGSNRIYNTVSLSTEDKRNLLITFQIRQILIVNYFYENLIPKYKFKESLENLMICFPTSVAFLES